MTLPLVVTPTQNLKTGEIRLEISGDLDLSTFAIVDEQHRFATRQGHDMCLDLSGVRFIDSAGLACLILAKRRAEDHRTRFRIGEVSTQVAAAFRLSALDQWFAGGPESPIVRIENPAGPADVTDHDLPGES